MGSAVLCQETARPNRGGHPRGPDDLCRYLKASEREKLYSREIPEDMRLGWTCDVPYCGKPEHFILEKRLNTHWRKYKAIRDRLSELREGEWFDLPDEPNDEKSRNRMRAALSMGTNTPHFLLRCLPRSMGVRLVRYGDYYDGQDINDYLRAVPLLVYERKGGKKPWNEFYLGFLSGAPSHAGDCLPRCEIKGCAYAAVRGAVCRNHALNESAFRYERNLDRMDMLAPKESPWMPLTLYRSYLGFDKRGFLNTETYWPQRAKGYGAFERKSFPEKMNDRWWKENVIEKGLVTDEDGIIHKFSSEEELRHKMEEVHWEQSMSNIRTFFGRQASGSLKMRLGGGRGKIRKKQRARPAGWTGHRDDTKSNKPDRETMEPGDDFEYEGDDMPLEDDYAEESMA